MAIFTTHFLSHWVRKIKHNVLKLCAEQLLIRTKESRKGPIALILSELVNMGKLTPLFCVEIRGSDESTVLSTILIKIVIKMHIFVF